MTGDELRAAFLGFFEKKGHKVLPSSSLIPHGDPTLLLTSAGMVQIKPYFLGEEAPPNRRLASCQKCFRTTDIESVGDATHLTFFEMLGNFSVGDYFKREAIAWAWEFVTCELGISPERLWITIYLDDDESYNIWKNTGVAESRILRLGDEDNFWGPAGSSGPCGPCSEIHYDFGEEYGCGRATCAPGCDCGRFSEIWNLVFTQYNQDEAGNCTRLPRPNIDTGMGLERTAAVLQGKDSVYESDLFQPLLDMITALSGRAYGSEDDTDNALRVVAEHCRGITFLIADGVMPENEGRGYVLRRLLRRAALFGRKMGLEKPFLAETAELTIEKMGHIYPELEQRRDTILKVIGNEEARFGETLNTGLELLDQIMGRAAVKKAGRIPGKEVFHLYDTYGFPVELTREVASGRGFSVDMAGFEREMEKQRERARAAHKFDVKGQISVADNPDLKATAFCGYQDLEATSVITALQADGQMADAVTAGQDAEIVLEATPFYGEMGGQVGDSGEIRGVTGRFTVTDTVRTPAGVVVHRGHITEGTLHRGDEVVAIVDGERRYDIARNHTATHLLQYALREVLGGQVQQRGSLVAPDRFRFDFSHLDAVTGEELQRVQRLVNEQIRRNLDVYDAEMSYKQAVAEGAIALFDEKYSDVVRVLKIGRPALSTELCGGTHVSATGEIGQLQILTEGSIGAGLRRIEAVTGKGVEGYIDVLSIVARRAADFLGTETDNVPDKVQTLLAELDGERKKNLALEREMGRGTADGLVSRAKTVGDVTLIAESVPTARIQALREMSDRIRDNIGSGIIVLGSVYNGKPVFVAVVTPDLVKKGYHAGKIVGQVAAVTGGGGGGKPTMAQAGGRDKDKLDEALRLVESLI